MIAADWCKLQASVSAVRSFCWICCISCASNECNVSQCNFIQESWRLLQGPLLKRFSCKAFTSGATCHTNMSYSLHNRLSSQTIMKYYLASQSGTSSRDQSSQLETAVSGTPFASGILSLTLRVELCVACAAATSVSCRRLSSLRDSNPRTHKNIV